MSAARKFAPAPRVDIAPPIATRPISLPPRPMPAGPREVTILEVLFSSPREWACTLVAAAAMAVILFVVCSVLWSLG